MKSILIAESTCISDQLATLVKVQQIGLIYLKELAEEIIDAPNHLLTLRATIYPKLVSATYRGET